MTRLTVSIVYCVRCNFLPRALWMANELLHTYPDFIEALELVPGPAGTSRSASMARSFFAPDQWPLPGSPRSEGGYQPPPGRG